MNLRFSVPSCPDVLSSSIASVCNILPDRTFAKPSRLSFAASIGAAALVFAGLPAQGATATKAGTGTDLTGVTAGVWTGGGGTNAAPGTADVATWITSSLGAGLTVDSNVSWGGINISGALTNIDISGAGSITLGSSGITLSGTKTVSIADAVVLGAAQTWNIGDATSSSAPDFTVSGTLTGSFALTKTGNGTLVLSGSANSFGATTVNAGTLLLDYTTNNDSKLTTGSLLTLGGGTLILNGNASADTAQIVNGLTLTAGTVSSIQLNDGGGQSVALSVGAFTRGAGSLLNLLLPSNPTATNSLLISNGTAGTILSSNGTAYAVVGGTDWASMDSTGTFVTGGSNVAGFYNTSNSLSSGSSINADISSATSAAAGTTLSSIRFNQNLSTANNTLTLAGNATAGGILVTSNVGSNSTLITGGTLTAANSGGELTVIQNNGSTAATGLVIASNIADNGTASTLTKFGTGYLTLAGVNTYSGATTVVAGTLDLANTFAATNTTLTMGANPLVFDSSVSSNSFVVGGLSTTAALSLQTNGTTPAAITLSVGGNNSSTTLSGAITGLGSLVKQGTGTLTLTSTGNSYKGNLTVNGGTLKFDTSATSANLTSGASTSVTVNPGASINIVQTYASTYISARTYTLGSTLILNSGNLSGGSTNGALFERLLSATSISLTGASSISQSSGGYTQYFAIESAISGTGTLTLTRASSNVRLMNLKGSMAGYSGNVIIGSTTATGGYVVFGNASGWGTGPLTLAGSGSNVLIGDEAATVYSTSWTGGSTPLFTSGTLTPTQMITVGQGAKLLINNGGTNAIFVEPQGGLTVNGGTLGYGAAGAQVTGTTTGTGGFVPYQNTTWTFGGSAASAVAANVFLNNSGTTFQVNSVAAAAGDTTISGIISGANGFTKTGTGMLTLSGASSYAGSTNVSAGTLNLTGTLTSNITVASGASLTGSGSTTGTINLNSGSNVIATATGVQGSSVTTAGPVNVFVNSAPSGSPATLNIVQYTGTGPGTSAFAASAPNYRSGSVNDTGSAIQLNYTGTSESWAATAGGTWANGTSTPWSGNTDSKFYWGDAVSFAATSANQTVSISGNVAPASIAVTNTANTYTIDSTNGAIVGASTLTKSGAGTLLLTGGANSYTGGTILSGGVLQLGNNGALGSGALSLTASSTVSAIGSAVTLGNSVLIASGAILSANSSAFGLTFAGGISGAGAFSTTSTGTTTLAGTNNTYTGATTVAAGGKLFVSGIVNGTSGVSVVGSSTGTLDIQNGGVLTTTGTLSTSTASGANVTIESGGTLNAGAVNIAWQPTTFKVDGSLISSGTFTIADAAPMTMTGAGTISASAFTVGNATTNITFNMTGTVSVAGNLNLTTTNTFTQNSGTISAAGLGFTGTNPETYTLNGGTLNIGSAGIASTASGTRNVNLGAGTIGANGADWSSSLPMALTDTAKGVTFNTTDSVDGYTGRNITLSGALTGAGSLNVSGNGKVVLSNAANTYTGTTTVNGGTLVVGGAISGTSAVTINGGAVQLGTNFALNGAAPLSLGGGTLNTNGHFQLLSTLTLTGGTSGIDFGLGNTGSTLAFSDSSIQFWNTNAKLTISDWNGSINGGGLDALFFGSDSYALTPEQIGAITFVNPVGFAPGIYTAQLLPTGELVAATLVPEPNVAAALLGGLGMLAGLQRFRRRS